jgi:hypothetical protein
MTILQRMSSVIAVILFYAIYMMIVGVSGMTKLDTFKMALGGTLVFLILLTLANYFHLKFDNVPSKIKFTIHFLCLASNLIFAMLYVFTVVSDNYQFKVWQTWIFVILLSVSIFSNLILFQFDTIKYRKRNAMPLIYIEYGSIPRL